jgi:alkylhydroperoxidase/carboxymuconolactone decarboxylase family protein YurZ
MEAAMTQQTVPGAWIALPSDEEVRALMPADRRHPYDFGFVAGMSRLIRSHDRIGPAFGTLFAQVMFAPGRLERREREMIAAVAAAAQDCHY